MFQILIF